jgi:hypothetical protein
LERKRGTGTKICRKYSNGTIGYYTGQCTRDEPYNAATTIPAAKSDTISAAKSAAKCKLAAMESKSKKI